MSNDSSKPSKFKIAKRDEASQPSSGASEDETPKRPLKLSSDTLPEADQESLTRVDDILEDAYGAANRARQQRERMGLLYRAVLSVAAVVLFFAGTLVYAHVLAGWPLFVRMNWYLPFVVSAVLTVWLCFKSVCFWQDRSWLLAVFGMLVAGCVTCWNVHVLEYVAKADETHPSNGFWAPASVDDLLLTVEINAKRGVAPTQGAYTQLPAKAYHRAFLDIPRDEWRSYFSRYLSADEMAGVNVVNIQQTMYLVTGRMQAQRVAMWNELEAQRKAPELEFRAQSILLKPYTWLLGYL